MLLPQLNSIEPPWYGPVCPVVWEGWRREVSPYPDQSRILPLSQLERVARPLRRRHKADLVCDRAAMIRVDVLRRLAVTAIEDRGRRGHLRRCGRFAAPAGRPAWRP